MANITKRELIVQIAEKLAIKQVTIKGVIQRFLNEIIEELGRNNRLELRDFCILEPRLKRARQAHNPKTGAKVMVPAGRTVKFKIGRIMKQKVQESLFQGAADKPA